MLCIRTLVHWPSPQQRPRTPSVCFRACAAVYGVLAASLCSCLSCSACIHECLVFLPRGPPGPVGFIFRGLCPFESLSGSGAPSYWLLPHVTSRIESKPPHAGASCWSGTDGPAQLFMGCIITSSGHLAVRRCRRMRLCHFVFRDLGMLLVLYLLVPPLVFRVCLACVVCSSSTAYGGWPA